MKRKITLSGGYKYPITKLDGTTVQFSNMETHATIEFEIEEGESLEKYKEEFKALLIGSRITVDEALDESKKKLLESIKKRKEQQSKT